MSNQAEETSVCSHCGGTGVEPAKASEFFPVGSKVHYKTRWWMYPKGTPAEVIAHSRSGQRIKIRYPRHDYQGNPSSGFNESYVTPKMLEPV